MLLMHDYAIHDQIALNVPLHRYQKDVAAVMQRSQFLHRPLEMRSHRGRSKLDATTSHAWPSRPMLSADGLLHGTNGAFAS
jgi:hypothetical protein